MLKPPDSPPDDLSALLQHVGPRGPSELADVLRQDQQRRWQRGEKVPAEDYLRWYPSVGESTEDALLLIYGEAMLRGCYPLLPLLPEYQQRFPQFAEHLALQFDLHDAIPSEEEDDLEPETEESPIQVVADSFPVIPGYQVLNVLGRGGMGVVYRARQQPRGRIVALKVLQAGRNAPAEHKARFRTEAEAVARLEHPHIVTIFDVGEHDGTPYFALECAPDGSLAELLPRGRPSFAEAAGLVAVLAAAIEHAHQRGIVHRDLKPANILLRRKDHSPESGPASDPPTGPGRFVPYGSQFYLAKVTDFGLAKRLGAAGPTQRGTVLGTPSYMAPEQAAGKTDQIGPAVDVYSLGAVLYELVTGRPPFPTDDPADTLLRVITEHPPAPSQLEPRCPADLEFICLKCLRKPASERYGSAAELEQALHRYLDGQPIDMQPAATTKPEPESLWPWLAVSVLLGALVAAVGGAVVWLTWPGGPQPVVAKEVEKGPARVVEAIFRENCYECHGGVKRGGGVNILDHPALVAGKKVIPGRPQESPLFRLLTAKDEVGAPNRFHDSLRGEEIDAIRRWVLAGAPPW